MWHHEGQISNTFLPATVRNNASRRSWHHEWVQWRWRHFRPGGKLECCKVQSTEIVSNQRQEGWNLYHAGQSFKCRKRSRQDKFKSGLFTPLQVDMHSYHLSANLIKRIIPYTLKSLFLPPSFPHYCCFSCFLPPFFFLFWTLCWHLGSSCFSLIAFSSVALPLFFPFFYANCFVFPWQRTPLITLSWALWRRSWTRRRGWTSSGTKSATWLSSTEKRPACGRSVLPETA